MQNLFFCMKKPEEETLNLVAHQALLLDNVVHCGGLFCGKINNLEKTSLSFFFLLQYNAKWG